jgi:predicted nucleotidyltransferase
MITKTQEQILAFLLSHTDEQFTIHGIAKELKKSYTLVYNNITELEKEDIIIKEDIPPGKIVKINKFVAKYVLINIESKIRQDFLLRHPWIKVMLDDILKQIKNPFFIMIIFGSYAKGKNNNKSDLDILFIADDKNKISELEDATKESYTKVKKSIHAIEIDNFKKMINNPEDFNIGNEAKKHHIILFGIENYYKLINNE